MFADEILELRLAGAIHDFGELSNIPITEDIVVEKIHEYADLYYDMQASIGFLPVPLDIMHTPNVCTFYNLYSIFNEIEQFYQIERKCRIAVEEYRQLTCFDIKDKAFSEWLIQYRVICFSKEFLTTEPGTSFLVFNMDKMNFRIQRSDLDAIFELGKLYYPFAELLS